MSKSLVGRVTFVDNSVKAFGKVSFSLLLFSLLALSFCCIVLLVVLVSLAALTSTTTAEEFRLSIVKRLDLTVGDTFALFEVKSASEAHQ